MPDGSLQYHYDGIQVRKVPLPLRVPIHHQAQSQAQPQPNSTPVRTAAQASTTVVNNSQNNQNQSNQQNPPGSPILTNLLHRKADSTTAPSVDPKVSLNFRAKYLDNFVTLNS